MVQIFSFVFEGRFGLEDRKTFPDALWSAVQLSTTKLEEKWKRQFPRVPLVPLRVSPPGLNDLDLFLTKVLDHLVLHHNERTDLFWELTSLFFLHAMVLQTLPVSERAQPLEAINDDFANKLITTFLPDLYSVITAFVLKFNHFVDIDGRIFITLLRFATSGDQLPTHGLEALVGPEISSRLETVWKSTNAPSPDLSKLLACCPTDEDSESESESESASDEDMTSFALFPFHNEVFDDELAAVHVTVAGQGQVPSSIRLEFSQDIPFSDTKHWHAHHRPILPTKHLGGETAKDVGERARTRQLRRDQRFMSQMQRLAATLTGASGKALQQILIPSTGRKVSEIIDDSSVGGPKRGKKVRPISLTSVVTNAHHRRTKKDMRHFKSRESPTQFLAEIASAKSTLARRKLRKTVRLRSGGLSSFARWKSWRHMISRYPPSVACFETQERIQDG